MKVKKLLLSAILTIIAVLCVLSTKTYATTGTWNLGVVKVREGGYAYKMNGTPVLKIVDKSAGSGNFNRAIYCLQAGQGFGSETYSMTDRTYNLYYDMVTEKVPVNSVVNLSSNYGSILWLLDNMYYPKLDDSSKTLRNAYLQKAFQAEFNNPVGNWGGVRPQQLKLTDDDIEVVQQWALWHFTNPSNSTFQGNLPAIQVSSTGDGIYSALDGADALRQDEAVVLYNYLVTMATANSTYSKQPTVITLNKTLQPTVKQQAMGNVNYMIVGPFEIQKTGNTDYIFEAKVTDNSGHDLTATICDASGNQHSTIRSFSEAPGNGQFYIKIEKANLLSGNISDIKLQMSYTTNDTTATFWTVSGSNVDQPVVVVDKTPKTVNDYIEVHIPKFDLALRKYIIGVTRNGVTQTIDELRGRVPTVDNRNLITSTNGKTDTTSIYSHRKDPVPVQTGDIVQYKITIYNEGEVDGRATQIIDYLPEGLVFNSGVSTDYTFTPSADGRRIVITANHSNNLSAYNGVTLDSVDIIFNCEVTKKQDKTTNADTVLTNVADITESYDVNGTKMEQVGDDVDSETNNLRVPTDASLPSYKGNDVNKSELTDENYFYLGQQDDDDFEKLKVTTPEFDLALRKYITHINGTPVEISREPKVDTTPLKNGGETAIYKHRKSPLTIKAGDVVRYTIRVYNEADVDGYVTIIEDYLPEELELVPTDESTINDTYGWSITGRIAQTNYLNGVTINAFDGGNTLDSKFVEIECRVKESAINNTDNEGKVLTNIAQINGDSGDDRDSTPANVNKPNDTDLPSYKGDNSNKPDLSDDNYFYKGQEDDDDFEKVKIYQPEYDLALRKFITKVDNEEITNRVPVVDVSPLLDDSEETTTAIYKHPKDPIVVKNGNIVVYTIRVYNEGKFDGYAEEIKDNIPEGLAFIIDNEINTEYGWKLSSDLKQVSTDYLSKNKGIENERDNLIKAFDPDTMTTLDYRDVKIAFQVTEPNTSSRIITNIAEIKRDDGKDIDSTPDNDVPDEDDIDVEHIKLRYFDLALRKFITKVESKTGTNLPIETDTTKDISREPKVEIDANGNIKYVHPKDPVIVANSDIVIYTLRVYNEGTTAGYAEEIKDDVPVGLELVPDHSINREYGWVMYDEDGNVTDDATKAKTIRTTYLSSEKSVDNIIVGFDRDNMATPAYKDVKVAFKVVEKNVGEERIVINTAEISKDSDDDEDSTPDNNVPDEDDIDKEYIKLKYFDLSLLKWVSKMMVTKKGETTVYETGYNGLEDPEPVVKYEIKTSEMKSIVIKYEYGIKITNEGQIAGYAKEVADYIPEGLQFIPEDNPLWTVKEDGKIVTNQLEDTLLQPGESATITVVFKWINNENNLGLKRNVAEISKDYNDKDAEDIDSTPDNQVPGEDDIDDAYTILSPKTGTVAVFVILPTMVLTILATGIVLIKKYVL